MMRNDDVTAFLKPSLWATWQNIVYLAFIQKHRPLHAAIRQRDEEPQQLLRAHRTALRRVGVLLHRAIRWLTFISQPFLVIHQLQKELCKDGAEQPGALSRHILSNLARHLSTVGGIAQNWNWRKSKIRKSESRQLKKRKEKRNVCILQKLQRKHIIAFAGHNIHTDSHMVWCGVCGCTTGMRYFKALQTFSDSYSFIFPEILNVKPRRGTEVSRPPQVVANG